MIRRIPIVPTLVVALAALLMVRLGIWQLHRLHEKEALMAHYAANLSQPPVALPALSPPTDATLYRRAGATCLRPVSWTTESGRAANGNVGWRHIALCATGAEGPGFAADMGISQSPAVPSWHGGTVQGRLIWRPSAQPLIARLWSAAPDRFPMIVAERPAPGLAPTLQPDPSAIPNNHLSYAVQWFIFAALSLLIYGLALRQRLVAPPHTPR